MVMIFPLEHCHTGGLFVVAKLKNKQAKPNPKDSIGNLVICIKYG